MDIAAIVFNITHNVIKIKQNHIVNLSAEIHNGYNLDDPLIELPMLEEFAIAVRKASAFPILDIASENLRKRVFSEFNNETIALPSHYYEKWVSLADIFIDFSWKSNPYFIQDIPDYYLNRYNHSADDMWHQIKKQGKKVVLMGLPTKALAKYYQLDYSILQNLYLRALGINYHDLKKQTFIIDNMLKDNVVWSLMTDDRSLQITFNIEDSLIYNGEFFNRCYIVLPTGKIEKRINHKLLDGILFAKQIYYENQCIKDVQIIFEKGKIIAVDFLSRNGDNFLMSLLSNNIQEAHLVIGMNPNLKSPIGYSLYDECVLKNCNIRLLINNKIINLANPQAKLYKQDINILSEV
ncbi:MAG TPA: hypothetical protein PLV22_04210 [Candidatus Cloacimonadota bacterium]|mgnify:FL=1|nr:hypothetical protein [Candidatus Cloacimonadota bacterium]